MVYEPTLDSPESFGSKVTHDLEAFKDGCDVIVANRWSNELADVGDKVYTRDLFKWDLGRVTCTRLGLTYSEVTLAEGGGVSANTDTPPPSVIISNYNNEYRMCELSKNCKKEKHSLLNILTQQTLDLVLQIQE